MKMNTPTTKVTLENLKTAPTFNLLSELDVFLDVKNGLWGSCLIDGIGELNVLARKIADIYKDNGDILRQKIALELAEIWENR